jgi:hypothetical protein
MKRLKLRLDELAVESFQTAKTSSGIGTVRGHEAEFEGFGDNAELGAVIGGISAADGHTCPATCEWTCQNLTCGSTCPSGAVKCAGDGIDGEGFVGFGEL